MTAKIYHFPSGIRLHPDERAEQKEGLYEHTQRVNWGILMRVRKLLENRGSKERARMQMSVLGFDGYSREELLGILGSVSNRQIKDNPNFYRAVVYGYEAIVTEDKNIYYWVGNI